MSILPVLFSYEHRPTSVMISPAAASVRSATPSSLCKLEGQGQSELRITAVQSTTTQLQSRPISPTTPTGFHFPRSNRYRVRAPRGDTPSIYGDPGGDEPSPAAATPADRRR